MPGDPKPVAIIMGSQSDWATMRHAAKTLDTLGIGYEARIVSAHRTPDRLYDFAKGAKGEGFKMVIAGAGGAAHLPGMAAALTPLPVFGVPVESKALSGVDSLHSIVQMPAGIPVGTLAIGRAGAINAALARRRRAGSVRRGAGGAARALARGADRALSPSARRARKAARHDSARVPPGGVLGILGGGQLGRMLALAAARLGIQSHVYCPDADSPAFQVARRDHRRALRGRGGARRLRRRRRRDHLRVREHPGSRRRRSCRRAGPSCPTSGRWRPRPTA